MKRWLAVTPIFCGILVGGALRLHYDSGAPPTAHLYRGNTAPSFSLPAARGGVFQLKSTHRQLIVLSFLRTQPENDPHNLSHSQMVVLSSMARQYGGKSLQVLAIDATILVTGHQPTHQALLNSSYDWNLGTLPLLADDGTIAHRFGVTSLPSTFLIDRDGRVLEQWNGIALPARLAMTLQRYGVVSTVQPLHRREHRP